ncbi:MAG: transcriptional repressor [Treponema sp.]|nr:transcriptional repressor [Treponema sp.]
MNYSRQREAILKSLSNRWDHPTADMIFEEVRQDFPKVSLGTVYRNLTLLCETGDIVKIATVKGFDRFDHITSPHGHFICSECTKVIDLEADIDKLVNKQEFKNIPGIIDRTEIMVYGLCSQCSENRTPSD